MQATGPGGVAEIVHALRFTQHLRPRHFIQMVCKCHWVRDEFQTIVQAAVRLDAQIFRVRIGDVQQFFGIVTVCTAAINFQFDAEMPQTLAVENEVGRVAIFVDYRAVIVPAGRAISVIIVPIGAVTPQNAVAICTTDVILIETTFAERRVAVLNSIFGLNPRAAGVADNG